MKADTAILLLASAVVALSTPVPSDTHTDTDAGSGITDSGTVVVCPSAPYLSPRCCAALVLGGAGVDCTARTCLPFQFSFTKMCYLTPGTAPRYPENSDDFSSICAADGKSAACCLAPVVSLGFGDLTDALLVQYTDMVFTHLGRARSCLPTHGWMRDGRPVERARQDVKFTASLENDFISLSGVSFLKEAFLYLNHDGLFG